MHKERKRWLAWWRKDTFMIYSCLFKVPRDTELDVLSSKRSHLSHVSERPSELYPHKYTSIWSQLWIHHHFPIWEIHRDLWCIFSNLINYFCGWGSLCSASIHPSFTIWCALSETQTDPNIKTGPCTFKQTKPQPALPLVSDCVGCGVWQSKKRSMQGEGDALEWH